MEQPVTKTDSAPVRVLVVDDEPEIAELIAQLLQPEGIEAVVYTDPERAYEQFPHEHFDLAILDIMMPKMDGFELCSHLRATSDIPIMFLSARDEEIDQVVGFTMGADDYVTKPFKPREFIARLRAHLRRSKRTPATTPDHHCEALGISLDLATHEASLHDMPLSLTPKEFAILSLLMQRTGQPVPAAQLYEHAWQEPFDPSVSNTVMVHIRHLREKLAKADSTTEFIQTVWGVGYRIPADPDRTRQ